MSKIEELYFKGFTLDRLKAARKKIAKEQKYNHGDCYVLRIFNGKTLKINKRKLKLTPVECFARLKDNDEFNYTKGCKIALAKAERKAYKYVVNLLKEEYNRYYDMANALNEFVFKGENIISHNTDYIKNITEN